jgi:hypothetical protein
LPAKYRFNTAESLVYKLHIKDEYEVDLQTKNDENIEAAKNVTFGKRFVWVI